MTGDESLLPPPWPISASEAGVDRRAGWLSPEGPFYPCARWKHISMAARLREAGAGPADPWRMTDGWIMVRENGEVVALPGRVTQAQLDTLMDMLVAAPLDSGYRAWMLDSLRQLAELEPARP